MIREGVMVGGRVVNSIRFADDQAIMAGSNDDLQRLMEVIKETVEKYGMKINVNKTKTMIISRKEGEVKVMIDGILWQQVKEFCYEYYE